MFDNCFGCCTDNNLMEWYQLYQCDSINTTDYYIQKLESADKAGYDVSSEEVQRRLFTDMPFSDLLPSDKERIIETIERLTRR